MGKVNLKDKTCISSQVLSQTFRQDKDILLHITVETVKSKMYRPKRK